MSKKYHISPTDGQPRPCEANIKDCGYGSDAHLSESQYQNYLQRTFQSADDVFAQVNIAQRQRQAPRRAATSMTDIDYAAWPIPQADDLDKVGAVVDSIAHEATTADAIGEAVGVGERNGSYYANAAGYLGLVEKFKDYDGTTQFSLTTAGHAYANAAAAERMLLLTELVERTPLAQTARDGASVADIRAEIAEAGGEGYSDSVARRRASTLTTWLRTLDEDRDSLTLNIDLQQQETVFRSVDAAMNQRRLAAERTVVASAPRRGEMCTVCFTEKSLAGECMC